MCLAVCAAAASVVEPLKGNVPMLIACFCACIGKLVNFGGEPAHLLLQAHAPSALLAMLDGGNSAASVSSSSLSPIPLVRLNVPSS